MLRLHEYIYDGGKTIKFQVGDNVLSHEMSDLHHRWCLGEICTRPIVKKGPEIWTEVDDPTRYKIIYVLFDDESLECLGFTHSEKQKDLWLSLPWRVHHF
jgi:hypothetical protein